MEFVDVRGVNIRVRVCSYEGLLRTAVADADGPRFLQEVEVLLLELEVLHTSPQAHHLTELRPAHTHSTTVTLIPYLNVTRNHVIKPNPYPNNTKPCI